MAIDWLLIGFAYLIALVMVILEDTKNARSPHCQLVRHLVKEQHPDWKVECRYRGTEGGRQMIVVLYAEPEYKASPSTKPYKIFAVAQDLSGVEERPYTFDSPYALRGRK